MALTGRLPETIAETPAQGADPAALESAYRAVRADRSIQFELSIPEPPAPPPDWMISLFGWLAQLGPVWRVIFWIVIAIAVVAVIVALAPPLRNWVIDRWRERRPATTDAEPPRWAPAKERAHALLEEADRLAASGDYDGAVHILLLRSIEDIDAWRGGLVRPSLTARDIAAVPDLPERARGVFARIAAMVERSLFAGRRLSSEDWTTTRDDYADFALARGSGARGSGARA